MADMRYPRLYQLLGKYKLMDFDYVKNASVDDFLRDYEQEHPVWCYADTSQLKFPCYDRTSTLLSYADYLDSKKNYSPLYQVEIENRFQKLAHIFDVEEDLKKIASAQEEKEEVYYALRVQDPLAGTIRAFPIRNVKEAKIAAGYLYDNWQHLTYELRKTAADNILNYADDKGWDLGESRDLLERFAGRAIFDFDGFKQAVNQYCGIAKQLSDVIKDENFTKIAAQINGLDDIDLTENVESHDIPVILECLSAIGSMAKVAGLEPPELMAYPIGKTQCQDLVDNIVKVGGAVYHYADLYGISRADLENYFSSEELQDLDANFVTAVQLKKFASRLNEEQAERFDQMLRGKGRQPRAYVPRARLIPVD